MSAGTPLPIAVTPDGKTVYVGNTGTLGQPAGDTVTVISTRTGSAVKTLRVGKLPMEIEVTP